MPVKAELPTSDPPASDPHELPGSGLSLAPWMDASSIYRSNECHSPRQPTLLSVSHHFQRVLGLWYEGGPHPNEVREWVGDCEGDPPKEGDRATRLMSRPP